MALLDCIDGIGGRCIGTGMALLYVLLLECVPPASVEYPFPPDAILSLLELAFHRTALEEEDVRGWRTTSDSHPLVLAVLLPPWLDRGDRMPEEDESATDAEPEDDAVCEELLAGWWTCGGLELRNAENIRYSFVDIYVGIVFLTL